MQLTDCDCMRSGNIVHGSASTHFGAKEVHRPRKDHASYLGGSESNLIIVIGTYTLMLRAQKLRKERRKILLHRNNLSKGKSDLERILDLHTTLYTIRLSCTSPVSVRALEREKQNWKVIFSISMQHRTIIVYWHSVCSQRRRIRIDRRVILSVHLTSRLPHTCVHGDTSVWKIAKRDICD